MSIKKTVDDLIAQVQANFVQAVVDCYTKQAEKALAAWEEQLTGEAPKSVYSSGSTYASIPRRRDGTWLDEAPKYVTHIHPQEPNSWGSTSVYGWEKKVKTKWYVDFKKCESDGKDSALNAIRYFENKLKKRLSYGVGRKVFQCVVVKAEISEELQRLEIKLQISLNDGSKFDLIAAIVTDWGHNRPIFLFPVRYENVQKAQENRLASCTAGWMKANF